MIGTLHHTERKGDSSVSRSLRLIFLLRDWHRSLIFPRLLILSALLICGVAIWKAADDHNEKEFIKSAVIGTLTPTPNVFKRINDDMNKFVDNEIYHDLDYGISSDGMVFYIKR